jgi:hypothetical protein
MSSKFEDLVKAINEAPNEFALSRLPFDVMKQGLTDLQDRLLALEARNPAK